MSDPHVVMDWSMTRAYGPFQSRGEAEKWLEGQGITEEMWEVSVLPVLPYTEKLEIIE